MTAASDPEVKVDLSNCDREPIHILGHVQRFGCLLALSKEFVIVHASENVHEYLELKAQSIIGSALTDYLSESAVNLVRSRLQTLGSEDAVERLFGIPLLPDNDVFFDVGMHVSGRNLVLEIERHGGGLKNDYGHYVRPMIERIKRAKSVDELCHAAAKQVRALTGFDRVMVYKFHPDDTGEVIAESVAPGTDSFLGQRYPASDIPPQARKLYQRNLLRIISDIDDKVSPIVPRLNAHGEPLDLSLSGIRSVSPIHLEYLRNMGVKASLSISILKRGKLWGMFACHHYTPRVLPYDLRSAAELFGQLFAFIRDQLETDEAQVETLRARELHDQLMSQLAEGRNIQDNFETIAKALQSVIPSVSAALWVNGFYRSIGPTPTELDIMKIVRFLNSTGSQGVYTTDCLGKKMPGAEAIADRAAGILALPISRTPGDYIILFRQEVARKVKWGGNPDKPVEVGPLGARLTPRKSFEEWQTVVRGCSDVWTQGQILTAEALRITLLEVVLRMSEAAHKDRLRSQERQELLIAELNHRVRNILNLIQALVNQSRSEARSVPEFTEMVGGRIHALARAHDQITRQGWEASSIKQLIHTEVEAYLGDSTNRVIVLGPDALLRPESFTSLALVIHEMATNSAKYGALIDKRGTIEIKLEQLPENGLAMHWREIGGPPVKAPLRRGFGSTVIERSVPFELGGTADIRFELTGVEATFTIPGDHVDQFLEEGSSAAAAARTPAQHAAFSGDVMILEDNMIIAMDAEDMVMGMGAKTVKVASTVAEALRILETFRPTFCLLDVNLGLETSEPVARHLAEIGVPFAFATGYGDASALTQRYPQALIVQKPLNEQAMRAALASVSGPAAS